MGAIIKRRFGLKSYSGTFLQDNQINTCNSTEILDGYVFVFYKKRNHLFYLPSHLLKGFGAHGQRKTNPAFGNIIAVTQIHLQRITLAELDKGMVIMGEIHLEMGV